MERGTLVRRLVDHWPVGMAVALGLASIPLLHWLGIAFAVLLMLRHGGALSSLGYVLVSLVAYFSMVSYSFDLLVSGWPAVLAMFLPLWAMAWLLRGTRSLNVAMVGGTFVFMALVLFLWLVTGPPDLNAWMAYFNCRISAAGLTEAQVLQLTPGANLTDLVQDFMKVWPLSLSLFQMGVLFLARWQQARLYNPGGFGADFRSLRLPKSVALFCAGLLIIMMFAPGDMITLFNLGMLALVLMGITGLGFVHGYIAGKHRSIWWLALVYLLILINLWMALMLLAAVALLDSSFNLKERVR